MPAILDVTGGVVNISGENSTIVAQPMEQALDVSDFTQLTLLLDVWNISGTSAEVTVSIYTAFQNTLEDGNVRYHWLLSQSFPAATMTGAYSIILNSSDNAILRYIRWEAQFTAGTGTLGASFSIKGFARTGT